MPLQFFLAKPIWVFITRQVSTKKYIYSSTTFLASEVLIKNTRYTEVSGEMAKKVCSILKSPTLDESRWMFPTNIP